MTAEIAQRLREAAADLPAEQVSVADLLRLHGPAARGSLIRRGSILCCKHYKDALYVASIIRTRLRRVYDGAAAEEYRSVCACARRRNCNIVR